MDDEGTKARVTATQYQMFTLRYQLTYWPSLIATLICPNKLSQGQRDMNDVLGDE